MALMTTPLNIMGKSIDNTDTPVSGDVLEFDGTNWVANATSLLTKTVRIPIDWRVPKTSASAGGAYFQTNALTAYDAGNFEFTNGGDGFLEGQVRIPNNLGATPTAKIIFSFMINATTGNYVVGCRTKNVANGGSMNPASLTAETEQTITVPGTAYFRQDVTFTLTNAPAADDILIVSFYHHGLSGSETIAAHLIMTSAVLECVVF